MISRDRPFDIYMDSYDQSFDAIVAIAMHAGAGNPDGFISHTYTVQDVQYRVNGTPFNETMILAMGAARFGIPVIMVSGDDQFEKEVKRYLPWVKYAAGKKAMGRAKAEPFPREEVSRRIEKAAREALLGLDSARLFEGFPGPYRFALTFQDESQAETAAELQGAELLDDGVSVQIRYRRFRGGLPGQPEAHLDRRARRTDAGHAGRDRGPAQRQGIDRRGAQERQGPLVRPEVVPVRGRRVRDAAALLRRPLAATRIRRSCDETSLRVVQRKPRTGHGRGVFGRGSPPILKAPDISDHWPLTASIAAWSRPDRFEDLHFRDQAAGPRW